MATGAHGTASRRPGARSGLALLLLALLGPAGAVHAQAIKWQSKDSVAGGPHYEAYFGATVRFNASLDDYGLQGSYTFNPVNIDTLFPVDRDDNLLSFDLRQTRIKFGGTVRYEGFGAVETYVETDFVGPSGQTTLRLRKAWVDFKGVRIGQETTTFGVQQGSSPTTADFDGPPTGVTTRSGMIRYARKLESGLQVMASLETPKVDVAYLEFFAPDVRATDQRLPDLAVNASKAGDWGYVSLSGLVREIRFRSTTSGVSEAHGAVGYGANLVGGLRLFKSEAKADVLYYQLVAGQGLGRYLVSLTGQNADALPDPATGELNAVPAYGGYVAYERRWSPRFFSTLIGAGNILKNEVDPTRADEFRTTAVMFNSFYQPIKTMKIGGEIDWGRKHTTTDIEAEALRYYLVVHYDL
ncbi:MAG TPA: DcaP family trimeric outer membrane transporter [Gemmatimonadales bacterium]|nr:DcaP family trimeric outer membrane transporter [Gemmatimonadales bacterium]